MGIKARFDNETNIQTTPAPEPAPKQEVVIDRSMYNRMEDIYVPRFNRSLLKAPPDTVHIDQNAVLNEIDGLLANPKRGGGKRTPTLQQAMSKVAPWMNRYENLSPKLLNKLRSLVERWKDPDSFKGLTRDPENPEHYVSTGGLIYGENIQDGHTINHIHAHFFDNANPDKLEHSRFSVPENSVFELIDEAWKKKGRGKSKLKKTSYNVAMDREIGTRGERKLRIVTENSTGRVVTAYPTS